MKELSQRENEIIELLNYWLVDMITVISQIY